ncbi:MAG TPA: PQQ-binding-like beta-propeller repeat protein [Mycobacterium sp.]|jgi:hypothetical protein
MTVPMPWGPQPKKHRGFDRRLLWVVLAVVVVVVVAVTAVAVVVLRDEASTRRPDGLLAGTYPRQPTVKWTRRADELLAGSTVSTTETQILGAFGRRGFVDAGDKLIVRVVAGLSHDTGKLAALDSKTGQVDWVIPFSATSGCSAHVVGKLLPCVLDKQVVFVRVSDGEITARYTPDFQPDDVTSDGDTVVVAGRMPHDPQTVSYDMVVTSGTVSDPAKYWTTKLSPAACHYGNSDNLDVVVRNGFVGTDLGAPDAALRLSDGSQLVDGPASLAAVYPRLGAAVQRCADAYPDNRNTATYFNADAREIRTGPLPAAPLLWVTALTNPPVITQDGTAVDFRNGQRKWSLPGFHNVSDKVAVVGDVALHVKSKSLTAYDLRTGESRWSVNGTQASWLPALTDGARIIQLSGPDVIAIALDDGSTAWTMSPDVSGDDTPVIGAADAGLVVMTDDSIALYPPTGAGSHVPS